MKMASALPLAEKNGLVGVEKQLLTTPDEPIVCIIIIDSSQTLIDHYKGTRAATISVKHIEPMINRDMRQRVLELLESAFRARTSEQLELPLFEDDPALVSLDGAVHRREDWS